MLRPERGRIRCPPANLTDRPSVDACRERGAARRGVARRGDAGLRSGGRAGTPILPLPPLLRSPKAGTPPSFEFDHRVPTGRAGCLSRPPSARLHPTCVAPAAPRLLPRCASPPACVGLSQPARVRAAMSGATVRDDVKSSGGVAMARGAVGSEGVIRRTGSLYSSRPTGCMYAQCAHVRMRRRPRARARVCTAVARGSAGGRASDARDENLPRRHRPAKARTSRGRWRRALAAFVGAAGAGYGKERDVRGYVIL